jgi:hypothetical protein
MERIVKDIEPYVKVKTNTTPVNQFGLDGKYIASFDSIKEASKETGISYVTICSCVNGKLKSAGGFMWRKAN